MLRLQFDVVKKISMAGYQFRSKLAKFAGRSEIFKENYVTPMFPLDYHYDGYFMFSLRKKNARLAKHLHGNEVAPQTSSFK